MATQESFFLALNQLEQAREGASAASAEYEVARGNLKMLQCGAPFIGKQRAQDFDYDAAEDEFYQFDALCELLPEHDGSHSIEEAPDRQLSVEYLKSRSIVRACLEAQDKAMRARNDAEDAFMAESCKAPGIWCLLWEGHEGEHEEAKELRIAL
ncbi:hypothetical protein [Glutamicibacter sp. FBE19]|uniref:hypothetical protein n=1 Tax=Glutamicibacter sp. FBE19 TaxID=2761534 RepID=UPI0018966891|nr:hypothetical protein [Glutamicibacter sp. FBE19]MBF6671139.1 hypothetical protein [Glutamicibacter sp. FBE19]